MGTVRNLFYLQFGLLMIFCSCGSKDKVADIVNPLPIEMGDPFLLHASDGKYYMYGTSLGNGFEAYVSDNLTDWQNVGQIYKGGGEDQWNVDCFWAPEVYERDDKYYMF